MTSHLLVTGAAGKVGAHISSILQDRGHAHAVGIRSTPVEGRSLVDQRRFDWSDRATWVPALRGIQALFLVKAPVDEPAPLIAELLDENQHLKRVVMLSELNCELHSDTEPQRASEIAVERSGIPFTILRPNWFFQNYTVGSYAQKIRERDELETASTRQPVSYIDTRDVAEVAVGALLGDRAMPSHVALTGGEALTSLQVAAMIGAVCKRPITVTEVPLDEVRRRVLGRGGSEASAEFIVGLCSDIAEGRNGVMTDMVQRVTGRRPISFADFAAENAARFVG